jgi:hypothetical protein
LYTERKRKLGEWRRERVRDKQRECCKREKEGLERERERYKREVFYQQSKNAAF